MLIITKCLLDFFVFDLFLVIDRLLQAYQFFLTTHQMSLSVLFLVFEYTNVKEVGVTEGLGFCCLSEKFGM